MKIFIVWTLFVASAVAEPPVDNRYLPPQLRSSGSYLPPSQTYGVPGAAGFGQRQTSAVFRGRQSSPFNRATSRRPSTQYGVPNQLSQPSNQYGVPNKLSHPSNQYGAPSQNSQPSNQYGLPFQSTGFDRQSSRLQIPGLEYGVPSVGAPSQQYGAPGLEEAQQYSQGGSFGISSGAYRAQEQSRQYLPPGRSGYDGEGSNGEPANYNFQYMVKDDPSGNDFGHREARLGDKAEGLYYVLLPDGRKQVVEYEADQEGYKPRISYEDTGAGLGGYDRNSQVRNGYQNQGGPY